MPSFKQASLALFYVVGASTVRPDGIDVEVKTVAARSQELPSQLEKGPLSIESPGKPACLNLCPRLSCVTATESNMDDVRIHVVADQLLTTGQVTAAWCQESLRILDGIVDKDTRYPKMVHGGVALGGPQSAGSKGAEMGAALGGKHTPDLWKHNPLGVDPGRFEPQTR